MNQENQVEKDQEPQKEITRNWGARGRIFGIPVSLIAIWAALFVVASAIPALPVPGMAGVITVNAVMTSLSGVILGPAAAIANMAGGIISMLLFPYGAFLGPLSFLTVLLGGLVSGLTFANRWKLAAVLQLAILILWFVNPDSWQPYMWIIPLPYSILGLIVIVVHPIRNWMRKAILELDKVKLWPALFLMTTIAHSAEFLTTNSMTNWMYNLSWQYWVPTYPYWVGVDTVIIVLSTIIGVAVLTGLRRARLPHASDLYK